MNLRRIIRDCSGVSRVEIDAPFVKVRLDRVSFGEIISMVSRTRGPMEGERLAFDSVADPEIAHINSLAALEANGLISDTLCGCVVGDDRSGGLRVAEVTECS